MNKSLTILIAMTLVPLALLSGCRDGGRTNGGAELGGGGAGKGQPSGGKPLPNSGAVPALVDFQPSSGCPGDPILVTGDGLDQVTHVRFGTVDAPAFHAADGKKLYVTVPPTAVTAQIRLEAPGGTATSQAAFTLRHPSPRLVTFSPHLGPIGTEVLLTGTHFTPDLKVQFGAIPAPDVSVRSLTQAVVKVPPGLHHGKLTLTTAGGHTESSKEFHVGNAPPLAVAWALLTQSTQTPAMKVPLVEGRDAFCMVALLASGPHQAPPQVRVRIHKPNDPLEFVEVIQPPPGLAQVPQAVDPANLGSLWTVPVPGKYIRVGALFKVEVLPPGPIPPTATPMAAWPGTAPLLRNKAGNYKLFVRTVPTLEVTLVPIIVDGLEGNVDTPPRKLEDWVEPFKAMFPVAKVVVKKGDPLHWAGTLVPKVPDYHGGLHEIAKALDQRRLLDGKGPTQFYYGVVQNHSAVGFGGLGLYPVPGHPNEERCAVGGDWEGFFPEDNRRFAVVFAHEMGHVLGCQHANSHPIDIPLEGVDPGFPYKKADIGVFGFDGASRTLKAPGSYKDIMSYTAPQWVSDYHYQNILEFLRLLPH